MIDGVDTHREFVAVRELSIEFPMVFAGTPASPTRSQADGIEVRQRAP